MSRRRVSVAYEDPAASRQEAAYRAKVRNILDRMGAPNSGELIHNSSAYLDGALRGGLSPEVSAGMIWHKHCSPPATVPCVAEGAAAAAPAATEECPCESAAACPPEQPAAVAVVGVAAGEEARRLPIDRGEPLMLDRVETGLAMHHWHAGMGDPLYAVGSYYVQDKVYPDKDVVEQAKTEAEALLRRAKYKGHSRRYTGVEWEELRSIIVSTEYFLEHDYRTGGRETAEARDSAPACVPFTKLERDPEALKACRAFGRVNTDADIYRMLLPYLGKQDQEVIVLVSIDLNRRVRAFTEIARGQRDRVTIDVADVVRAAAAAGPHAVILAHNHPSGNANPSDSDKLLTDQVRTALAAANLLLADHVVVGDGEWFSFADGRLKKA